MANIALKYEAAIKGLFPKGKAFKFLSDKSLNSTVKAIALPFYRVDNRAKELIEEMNPLFTLELLPEWERVLGLPNSCSATEDVTIQERRFQVLSKLSIQGGQSKQFYINLIKSLGFNIEIKEHSPFVAGSSAGDDLANTTDWQFTWDVVVLEAAVYYFVAGSSAGESLRVFRNEIVQCFINQMKPAHTFVRFIF
jgi:uncharacterized protein YmfQ (DUF2313 family)